MMRWLATAPFALAGGVLCASLLGCAAADVKVAHAQAVEDLKCNDLAVQKLEAHGYLFEGCGVAASYTCNEMPGTQSGWTCVKR